MQRASLPLQVSRGKLVKALRHHKQVSSTLRLPKTILAHDGTLDR
jgi:hypothetical protein